MSELWLSQFSAAYEHLDSARKSSERRADHEQLAWASLDLSTLDLMLSDLSAAVLNAQKARSEFLLALNKEGVARALINLGTGDFLRGEERVGKQEFLEAVEIDSGDQTVQALAWEHLGVAALKSDSLSEAELFLNRAARSWERLGDSGAGAAIDFDLAEVRIKQGRILEAEHYLGLLNAAEARHATGLPRYAISHQRGMLEMAKRNKSSALRYTRLAANLALEWRKTTPINDRLRSFVLDSLKDIFSDYITLVSREAIITGNESLLSESFAAQAKIRALSLQEQTLLSPLIRPNSSSTTYRTLLERLSRAEAEEAFGGPGPHADPEELRIRLSEMQQEAIASSTRTIGHEPFPADLNTVQRSLSNDDLLLCFYSGRKASFLWAATRSSLNIYELAPDIDIVSAGESALKALRSDIKDKQPMQHLARLLFAQLPAEFYSRYKSWIIVADQNISQLPISALPSPDDRPLVRGRTIQFALVPIFTMQRRAIPERIDFVGVGDAIYNQADERLARSGSAMPLSIPTLLPRLPGSWSELKFIAQFFGANHSRILSGSNASLSAIRDELEKKPTGVLHFAAHFIQIPPSETAIVLSLDRGVPELLTKELASTFPITGGLVVLDGCSSGQDRASLEGVLGQARGWLIAGSPAVVVTLWPISDSGRFFRLFYKRFLDATGSSVTKRAAVALQEAQIDMMGLNTSPSEWAAYRLLAVN